MRQIALLLLLAVLFLPACNTREKDELRQKEELLKQKEQELMVKENNLQLKEEALLAREEALKKPVEVDTTANMNPALLGLWSVTMNCIETTCPGSAVGDTKTEQWDISFQENKFIAKAMANDKLVRIYSGIYTGNTLELIAEPLTTDAQPGTKMIARLRKTEKNTLEGQREIIRAEGCKIIYELQMTKQ